MNGDGLRPQSVRGEAMLLADTLGAQHTITKPRGACSWGEVSGAGLHAKQGALQRMPESSPDLLDLLQSDGPNHSRMLKPIQVNVQRCIELKADNRNAVMRGGL